MKRVIKSICIIVAVCCVLHLIYWIACTDETAKTAYAVVLIGLLSACAAEKIGGG